MTTPIVEAIFQKTKEYLAIPSVVGFENPFLQHLKLDFQALGCSVDLFDGYLVVNGARPLSHIVTAHVDRHGLVSLGDGEFVYAAHYIKEIEYGLEQRPSDKFLKILSERFLGEEMYAYDLETGKSIKAGKITGHKAFESANITGNMVFYVDDMGAQDVGVPVSYNVPAVLEDGYLSGQIDNAISVATMNVLYQNGYDGTLVLTTEEEIGKSWTHIVSFFNMHKMETDRLFVLDTSPYKDTDALKDGLLTLRHRDRYEVFNDDLSREIEAVCHALSIPCHYKDEFLLADGATVDDLGATELGRLITSANGKLTGTTIQLPTSLYHSSRETAQCQSIENYYKLLFHMLVKSEM